MHGMMHIVEVIDACFAFGDCDTLAVLDVIGALVVRLAVIDGIGALVARLDVRLRDTVCIPFAGMPDLALRVVA